MKKVLPFALVVGFLSMNAFAQTTPSESRQPPGAATDTGGTTSMNFESLDKNKDGKITKDEAAASAAVAASFDVADKNGDGAISKLEYKAYFGV